MGCEGPDDALCLCLQASGTAMFLGLAISLELVGHKLLFICRCMCVMQGPSALAAVNNSRGWLFSLHAPSHNVDCEPGAVELVAPYCGESSCTRRADTASDGGGWSSRSGHAACVASHLQPGQMMSYNIYNVICRHVRRPARAS